MIDTTRAGFASKRTHACLGDACADAMATRLDEARTRIAARNRGATGSSR